MRARVIEAVVLTVLAGVAMWLGPWRGLMQIAELGMLVVVAIAVIAWLSLAFTLRAPAPLESPAVELPAPILGSRFLPAAFIAVFAIVPLVIFVATREPARWLVFGFAVAGAVVTAL